MATVSKIGYVFTRNEKVEQDAGDIRRYLEDTHGLVAEIQVGYDGDGDGKFDDILVMFDPEDEAKVKTALIKIKTYINKLASKPLAVSVEAPELDLTVKKRFDKAGKEKK